MSGWRGKQAVEGHPGSRRLGTRRRMVTNFDATARVLRLQENLATRRGHRFRSQIVGLEAMMQFKAKIFHDRHSRGVPGRGIRLVMVGSRGWGSRRTTGMGYYERRGIFALKSLRVHAGAWPHDELETDVDHAGAWASMADHRRRPAPRRDEVCPPFARATERETFPVSFGATYAEDEPDRLRGTMRMMGRG